MLTLPQSILDTTCTFENERLFDARNIPDAAQPFHLVAVWETVPEYSHKTRDIPVDRYELVWCCEAQGVRGCVYYARGVRPCRMDYGSALVLYDVPAAEVDAVPLVKSILEHRRKAYGGSVDPFKY